MKYDHNNPPDLTPFEESREEITELHLQAKDLLDGEPIKTQVQADEIQTLMRTIQGAMKTANLRRGAENKPFDDGKKSVQEKYNELIGKTTKITGLAVLGIQACKDALAPYLQVQEEIRLKKVYIARKAAAEKKLIAEEQIRKARENANLESRVKAESLYKEAKEAEKAAEIEKTKASGMGRAATLRTRYEPEIVDLKEAAAWFWVRRQSYFEEFILQLAKQEGSLGNRNIDGIKFNKKVTVV